MPTFARRLPPALELPAREYMTTFRSGLPGLRAFRRETAPVHLACHAASDGGTRDPISIQASCENTQIYGKRMCGMRAIDVGIGAVTSRCVQF